VDQILLGKGEQPVYLLAKYGNRHGNVAGATGTGKTVSLMVMAEGFSRLGVPVFMADVKGDVAGLAVPGSADEKTQQRAKQIGITNFSAEASPVVFWDLYGKSGHPVRTTVSEIGPTLLGRILELNDVQVGTLEVAFKLADDRGLLLLDLDDLRALLTFVADSRKEVSTHYGLVSAQSIAAIQRALLTLEREDGESLFGEPALDLNDLMRTDLSGRGIINILAADRMILKPRLFSTFLLWLLSELYEHLPEVGDLDKPKLVFFFDEAHLLFGDAPPALQEARGGFALMGGSYDRDGYVELKPAYVLAPAIAFEPFIGLSLKTDSRRFVYGLAGTLNLAPDWAIAPFVTLGFGGMHETPKDEQKVRTSRNWFQARAGGGLLVSLRWRVLFRLEASNMVLYSEDAYQNVQTYIAGLGTYF